jgi:hypothetical protein
MKTHHLSNLVVVLVLIAALAGLYVMFNGVGRAIYVDVEEIVDCCCTSERGIFEKSSGKTFTELTIADCAKTCAESSTTKHLVTSTGMC